MTHAPDYPQRSIGLLKLENERLRSENDQLQIVYEQSRKWSKVWKEAATLNRYRANNWLSLTLTYSQRLGQVEQWAQTWKRAAKRQRERNSGIWEHCKTKIEKLEKWAQTWKLAAKKQRENFKRLYKVALATVEIHETVKTYGEDATQTNE